MDRKEIKTGECYSLNPDKAYFSIDLQRYVKFSGTVEVKVGNRFDADCENSLYFGRLIDRGPTNMSVDRITTNEIEFVDSDVIEKYEMKKMPTLYTDMDVLEKKIVSL